MSLAIHWFRRDLRLTDNTALNAALAAHDQVVTVYILSEWQGKHRWTGAPRQEFLCGCLQSLARDLESKGGQLVIRQGQADAVLPVLARECGAAAIYFNRDPDPFGRTMEAKLEEYGRGAGIAIASFQDVALHERGAILTGSGTPFKVFTPYAKAWRKKETRPAGAAIARIAAPRLPSDPLPSLATWGLVHSATVVQPGEAAARLRLFAFLAGPILDYTQGRNMPAAEATSRLSQDLRHGTLSIREVYACCRSAAAGQPAERRESVETFIGELIWRDFYMQVLWHWPEVLESEFAQEYRGLRWKKDPVAFARWKEGRTGFPIVDAGMRQLAATGFMHNRVRMITAMFLTKDLHLDWRLGEQWFMQCLVDGDIGSNNGGWQWSASTGTDAAPYFRIQNPWAQTKRFDPDGFYIRRWVSELREVAPVRFCAPPSAGEMLAPGYPPPMLEHGRERDVALEMYRRNELAGQGSPLRPV